VRPYLKKKTKKKKPIIKIGLVEWHKVKALSSNPSTTKKIKNKNHQRQKGLEAWLKCLAKK
jgi:hypothetical protein